MTHAVIGDHVDYAGRPDPTSPFILAYADEGGTLLMHRDGISWTEVPPPRRRHECWAQTIGWTGPHGLSQALRCPCGAIKSPRSPSHWGERNSRRRSKA